MNLKVIRYQNARTVILPVFYVYETWSHTLREERRLRVFENRVLRNKFGPKTDEITGTPLLSRPNTMRSFRMCTYQIFVC